MLSTTLHIVLVAGMSFFTHKGIQLEMVSMNETIIQLDMVCQERIAIVPVYEENTKCAIKLMVSHPSLSYTFEEITLKGHLPRKEKAPDIRWSTGAISSWRDDIN